MYRFAFGFFYLLSLLPFPVLYIFADCVYFILFYVVGYRKKLVANHILQAFPDYSEAERRKIMKAFYKNFADTWVEMIKILSLSENEAKRRIEVDFSALDEAFSRGESCQVYAGHFMNWEYINVCVPRRQPFPFLAIYMPLSNPTLEKLVFHLRSRFGTKLLRAGKVKEDMLQYAGIQYMLGLGADQSPPDPARALWLYYLNRPTGFVPGPWEKSIALNQPTFYLRIRKPKRGYYFVQIVEFEPIPATKSVADLINRFVNFLEEDIHKAPELYLWTHKRWKKTWKPEYKDQFVDQEREIPA